MLSPASVATLCKVRPWTPWVRTTATAASTSRRLVSTLFRFDVVFRSLQFLLPCHRDPIVVVEVVERMADV